MKMIPMTNNQYHQVSFVFLSIQNHLLFYFILDLADVPNQQDASGRLNFS
jgi:hypothetical protein